MVKKKSKKERKIEKELLFILGFIVFLVIVFLIASYIFRSFSTFDYEGLTFTKERLGEIPIFHYYYYFPDGSGISRYNLYVRNDPRENDVPVSGGNISFRKGEVIFISVNPEGLTECRESVLAIADLSGFLSDNGFDVKGANLDFWDAGYKRQAWVTCDNRPSNSVISISHGEETGINIDGKCYEITVSDCNVLKPAEKFKLKAVLDAKNSAPKGTIVGA